ncbi:MAG: protein kinase domain-containing protein [Polyangiaceae bacterium]|jgi:eukaryotic-like serine/threonine-protein kinase
MAEIPEAPPSNALVAGKYQLVRLIGRGGMGTVWEGRHASLGTRVAIKFIDVEYADSQEARTRFDNEARAAATIQSKHAIQIFDHGVTDDGKPYIVMELLLGEPLDARLDRVGRLPLAETARILRQVGRALSRAHERGIVHRDLKPENIFLVRTPDEDDEIAKVLDFGIAKFKKVDGQSGGLTSSTKTGAVLGTPFYMAPEQARGLRDLDHRVDLWSMGVIAYKCVCGVLPFEGVSVGDLLVKICTTPAPIPSSVLGSLPPAFDAWFLRALEKDPARRFQNALELSDSLAMAAGMSVKRNASMSPTSDPLAAPAASNPPTRLSRSGSATSAPFTASNPRANLSSRSIWITAGSASFVGIGLVLLFATLYSRGSKPEAPHGVVQNATASAGSAPAEHAAVLPASEPVAANVADAGSATIAEGNDRGDHGERGDKTQPQDKGQHHHQSPRPAPTRTSTGATSPPSGALTTNTQTAAPLPPPVTAPKPAPKPTPSAVDFGY